MINPSTDVCLVVLKHCRTCSSSALQMATLDASICVFMDALRQHGWCDCSSDRLTLGDQDQRCKRQQLKSVWMCFFKGYFLAQTAFFYLQASLNKLEGITGTQTLDID